MANNNRFAVRKNAAKKDRYVDYNMLVAILALLVFGLVMVYSSSSYDAYLTFGDASYYLNKQIKATLGGIVFMIGLAVVPYHFWERVRWLAYAACYVTILLIIPLGYEANGARRWIRIFGVSMQPAEVCKIGVIIFLAAIITRMGRELLTWKGFFTVLLLVAPISAFLWVLTSNASSAIIVMAIAVLMLFVSTPDYRRYVLGFIVTAIVAGLAVLVIVLNARGADSAAVGGYRGARVLAWLDPEAYASGKGFQTLQALYAIGSGGYFGKGIGESMQKLGFIPEAQNDMIFSVICEELGLFGALALMLLFIVLLWRLKLLADCSKDLFGALIVVGVMSHIAIQVILNIAVVTNLIPNTGISLPFISYGGSATFFLLGELGLCFGVARGIHMRDL